jgi:adenosylcobyric acid synthase
MPREARLEGYEIHMGQLETDRAQLAVFDIVERNGRAQSAVDGAVGCGGAVIGTMIHGLFDNDAFRSGILRALRRRKGAVAFPPPRSVPTRQDEYDRLARILRESLDRQRFARIVGLRGA